MAIVNYKFGARNSARHEHSRVTSYADIPASEDVSDGDIIIWDVGALAFWRLMFNSTRDQWEFIGGGPYNQYRYGGLTVGSNVYGTITGETLSLGLPAGLYHFDLGFYTENNVLNSYVGMSVMGNLNTEALTNTEVAATGTGNASCTCTYTVASDATIVPYWIRTSGSCTVYRAHWSCTPVHIDGR